LQFLSFFSHVGPGFVGLDLVHLDVLDHLVMKGSGMIPSPVGIPQHGIQGDVAEATGGPHPISLHDVLGDSQQLLCRQLAAVEWRAVPFREVLATTGAAETANLAFFARPTVRAEIGLATLAKQGTFGVGTSESGPITLFHDALLARLLMPQQHSGAAVRAEGR